MSSMIFNMIAKKALKDVKEKNLNAKDPYFEEVPVLGRDGRETGKTKKQKKGLPAGLSENDTIILKKVRKRAYRLDMSLFNLFGITFGWSSVVGIIPVIGDFIDLLLALTVVRTCSKIDGGMPPSLKSRMYINILLDFGVGLVPFVGDLADAVFRANTRNCWALEQYLKRKAESERTGHSNLVDEEGRPVKTQTTKQSSGGWRQSLFGGGAVRPADEEMAVVNNAPPQSEGVTSNGRTSRPQR